MGLASSADTQSRAAGRVGSGDASEHRERCRDARRRVVAVVVDDQLGGEQERLRRATEPILAEWTRDLVVIVGERTALGKVA